MKKDVKNKKTRPKKSVKKKRAETIKPEKERIEELLPVAALSCDNSNRRFAVFASLMLLLLFVVVFLSFKIELYIVFKIGLLSFMSLFLLFMFFDSHQKVFDRETKVRTIGSIVILGFFAAVAYMNAADIYFKACFPEGSIYFLPHDRFMDFINNYKRFGLDLPSNRLGFSHTLNNYIMRALVPVAGENWKQAYFIYCSFFVFFMALFVYVAFYKDSRKKSDLLLHTFALAFMTYPFMFVIDRGNQEMFTFIFFSGAMLAYAKRRYVISAFLLSVVISMQKIYFAAFVLLFLIDRKYRAFIMVFIFTNLNYQVMKFLDGRIFSHYPIGQKTVRIEIIVGFTVAAVLLSLIDWEKVFKKTYDLMKQKFGFDKLKSFDTKVKKTMLLFGGVLAVAAAFICFKPAFDFVNTNYLSENLSYNRFVIGNGLSTSCSSIFCIIKEFILDFEMKMTVVEFFRIYPYIILGIMIPVLLYLVFIEKILWKRVTILFLMIVLFPFVTTDYRLLSFLVPIYFYVHHNEPGKFDKYYVFLFGLSIIPYKYFIIRNVANIDPVGIDTIIRPIVLSVFMVLLITDGMMDFLKKRRENGISNNSGL